MGRQSLAINDNVTRYMLGADLAEQRRQLALDIDALDNGQLHYGQLERIAERLESAAAELRDWSQNGAMAEEPRRYSNGAPVSDPVAFMAVSS